MRCGIVAAFAGLFGFLSASLAYAQEGGAPAVDPSLQSYVDGVVQATMEDHHIVCLSLSIVDGDRIIMTRGFGYADWETRRPVDSDRDIFRIGSISKTFTFTALMQLVEEGKVEIDADVNTYLAGFRIPDAFGAPITIRDLLSHRPGFEETVRNALQRPDELDPLRDWVANNVPARVLPPGSQISYSNYGGALAGYIVEAVSGEPYEQYVETHILQPLHMDSTTARQILPGAGVRVMSAALASRVVTGYTLEHGAFRRHPFDVVGATPAGAMSSTAPDMARYMLAHLNNGAYLDGQILKPETELLLRQRPYPGHPGPDWAYGFRNGALAGYDTFEHAGAVGPFYSTMVMIPELKLGVFVAVNSGDSPVAQLYLANDILVRMIGARAMAEPARVQLTEAQLAQFTGAYMTTRRSYTQFYKLLSLFGGGAKVALTGDGGLRINAEGELEDFYPIGPRSFRGRYRGEIVVFDVDESGTATRIYRRYGHYAEDRITASTNPTLFYLAFGVGLLLAFTHLVAAWKRRSEGAPAQLWARRAYWAAIAGAGAIVLTAILFAAMLAELRGGGDVVLSLPTMTMMLFLASVLALGLSTLLVLAGLYPALFRGGLSIWRKVHYVLLAVAMVGLMTEFFFWNAVGFRI